MNARTWIRRRPVPDEMGAAVGAALVVGLGTAAVTYWLVRTLVARDPVDLRVRRRAPVEEGPGRLP